MTSAHDFAILQAQARGVPAPAKHKKIPARKVVYDGFVFDSGIEFRRYQELRLLEKAGQIKDLQVHPEFEFVIHGHYVAKYTADFEYWEKNGEQLGEYRVVEDVKSAFTRKNREYRRNRKLMEACHGITIREIVR